MVMQYVRTQQQLNRDEGIRNQLELNTPFHSKKESDRTLEALIGMASGTKATPRKIVRLIKGKSGSEPYNGFHNQVQARLKQRPFQSNTISLLSSHPISTLSVLSKVTQAENDIQGLSLVRRKRRKHPSQEMGFSHLLGLV